MQLEARGVPAHTRTLSITLRHADAERAAFSAYLLDLRKRGFVPVGGDVQGPGIIHHMTLSGHIDRRSEQIEAIQAEMPTVAFEANAATAGESCRDRIDRVARLAGTPLALGYASRVGAEIGGVNGCSHVLTLAQLLGPTASRCFEVDRRQHGTSSAWRAGERIFRRDIVIDGSDWDGCLSMAALLTDIHFRPQPEDAPAATRFGDQLEIRLGARIDLAEMRIAAVEAAERRRGAEDLDSAAWEPRPMGSLAGLSLRPGIARELISRLGSDLEDRPLLDLLLMVAPATLQCVASFIDTYTHTGSAGRAAAETGGHVDSCYMWRRDGALQRRRALDV